VSSSSLVVILVAPMSSLRRALRPVQLVR
jgi:hypothetical protein